MIGETRRIRLPDFMGCKCEQLILRNAIPLFPKVLASDIGSFLLALSNRHEFCESINVKGFAVPYSFDNLS